MSHSLAYLEGAARRYALAAAKAESDGDYSTAFINLRRAIEVLEEITRHYPDHPLTPIYKRLLIQYKKKLEELEKKNKLKVSSGGEDEEYYVEITNEGNKKESTSQDDLEKLLPPFIIRDRPNVTFNDIAGLEHAKEAIREAIVYPVKRPDLFPLGWPRGILLFGPPGTGKTMLGAAAANEVGAEFLYVDAASVMSKWLGEGEKNVRKIFTYARERSKQGVPVTIFIDEVDALLGVHEVEVGGEVRVRNQFLKEMDGVLDKKQKLHVYVIGATNKPWELDEAFLRRFQKRIYVPLPDRKARLELLKMLTNNLKLANDVSLEELVDMLEGYSGSDIRDVVVDAHMRTVREFFQKGGTEEPRPISMKDFIEVIARRKPSVDQESLKRYEDWARRFGAL
ncbi:MAG: AAA family ATPase [Acidilobaceae archaeon]